MDFLERREFIREYFIQKGYKEVSSLFQGNPKTCVHIFSTEIKNAIARGNNIVDEFGPDFALVKSPEISVRGFQLVKAQEQTRFSLWRILDDGEKPPFVAFRKEGKVIRNPEFRKYTDYWEVMTKLLIRE